MDKPLLPPEQAAATVDATADATAAEAAAEAAAPAMPAEDVTADGVAVEGGAAEAVAPLLSFSLDAESKQLYAAFEPVPNGLAVDRSGFDAIFRASAFSEYHLDPDAVENFLTQCAIAEQPLRVVVGEARDAECWLALADDLMSVRLTLLPAQGGAPIGNRVEEALRAKSIVYGIMHEVLDAALADGFCDDLLIAQGTPAREGVPARFDSMLDERPALRDHDDDRAIIKFRDLGHLLLVSPGNSLMRRTAPIQGVNGSNVLGETVYARPLPDLAFGDGFAGARPDPNNPDLLVAAIAGQPMLVDNGVVVNPVIEVHDIDLSTGNVTFDGTIHISGDVKAGLSVKVSGDVIVKGMLEAAQISAGGNVAVAGGIVGRAESGPGAMSLPSDTARVVCGGSLQALFVESAHIEAGDSILIERSARQCELIAQNEIVVGAPGSKVSQIVGGLTQARTRVRTSVLGAAAGVKTRVQVGFDPFVNSKLLAANKDLAKRNDELQRVLQLLLYFRQNPKKGEGGVLEKVNGSREKLIHDIGDLNLRIEQLKQDVVLDGDARVQVDKTLYFGAEIRIGNKIWQVNDDTPGSIIGLVEGKIATGLSAPAVRR